MKVKIRDMQQNKIKPFPKIMGRKIGNNHLLVLFNGFGFGTVICNEYKNNNDPLPIGYYKEDWDMATFKDFHGYITISEE